MAQAPTLHDFEVQLSDVERGVDARLTFKLARHPSETLSRVWLRVLAYAIWSEERLTFGPGLSDPDAPDLETRDFTGTLTRWIRVGKADPAKVQRAASHHAGARVGVLFESPAKMEAFLTEARDQRLTRLGEVELLAVDPALLAELATDEGRRSKLILTLVGSHAYVERSGKTFDGPLSRGQL